MASQKQELRPGLLSKVNSAFMKESDESPYRFWLASCIEAYLRGSSPLEQMFVAQSGLMNHLVEDVSSDRLHCAGSLQTSFDLLGELGKGNTDVALLLVDGLDEERFRKLMSVAAANLVDSNVFIRSLLLSLERLSGTGRPLYLEAGEAGEQQLSWASRRGSSSRSYLTHSWWDVQSYSLEEVEAHSAADGDSREFDESRASDWFPSLEVLEVLRSSTPPDDYDLIPAGLDESVGHFGWVFAPAGDSSFSPSAYLSNTVERLSWFLAANQARLLRDLLAVVDLRNINHENICCLNTAVMVAIFAHRRHQLPVLLDELRRMNDEEKETKRRALEAAGQGDSVDRAFARAMRSLDYDTQRETPSSSTLMPSYARIGSIGNSSSAGTTRAAESHGEGESSSGPMIGDRADTMRNFREVLWFWAEYYTHRGRDRLSLEFSSHLRFQEWMHVVSLLSSDDGSGSSLLRSPTRLPRSPYQRSVRVQAEGGGPLRGI
jgi:hypothetical protein